MSMWITAQMAHFDVDKNFLKKFEIEIADRNPM